MKGDTFADDSDLVCRA